MAARNRPSRSVRQQRSPPPRRSDERNTHHQPSRYDFMDMGMGGPPPQSLARRAQEMGMSSRSYPPPSAKLSGNAFSEAELLNEIPKKKFTGRCRLFVGNLPIDLKEEELKELFTPHGDLSECYLSGKGFAFLRLDSRAHAESAKEALDGKSIKGRQIRVRFAVHGATIKVKELSPAVSNEMLNLTFGAFGEVERAIHIVDEKGRPTGEGIIEFEKKSSAQEALAQIKERVFLMTANSRPLQVEILEPKDEEDGLSEKMIQKTHQLIKERELGPRFAAMNSFEYVYGRRWKELYDFEHKRRQELDAELREGRRRLDADMEVAYEDYKAELLREELERRKEELDRLEAARRARDQQRQQMLDQMGERWVPPIVDGPMGRPPPTFGGRGGPHGGGGAGMAPPPFGHQPGMGMGGLFDAGNGRGLLPPSQQANGHGQLGGGQPQQQSLLGPDVRKLLQTFKDSPNIPGSARPGGDIGRQQGLLGAPPAPGGGIPPPPNSLGGGGPDSSPLSIFANMINPLMQRPPSGGAGGHQQQQGPPPPPFGAGTGGRIPPPPPPMGAMPPPPQMMNMMMQDYPPPEKRTRH